MQVALHYPPLLVEYKQQYKTGEPTKHKFQNNLRQFIVLQDDVSYDIYY